MAKEFAKAFYSSKRWTDCKNAYIGTVGGLCERCLDKGIYKSGDVVHHKIRLTPLNINDPSVSLNFKNLEYLCHDCHNDEHKRREKRYTISDFGEVTGRDIHS